MKNKCCAVLSLFWIIATFCGSGATAFSQTRLCLTGNAPDPASNAQIQGRYTYYDGGTVSYRFPYPLAGPKASLALDEPKRNGGWVPFREGVLTDGKTETAVSWPGYQISSRGIDVVFDLGQEYFIDAVEMAGTDNSIRNVALWLKSPGETRETMVHMVTDRPTFATNFFPKLENPYRLTNVNASAQWVRLNGAWKNAGYRNWSEIRIWGRPMQKGDGRPPKIAFAQQGGKFHVAKPKEITLESVPDRAIFPIPREMKSGKGAFALSLKTRIVIAADASPRTETTARVFAEDLKQITGLELKIERGSNGGKDCIVIGSSGGEVGAQGYIIQVEPTRVAVAGHDDQGTYYGTQSLLQLVGLNAKRQWDVPVCAIRDWPTKPIRWISGNEMPTEGLIRALGRYKINYYNVAEGPNAQMGIQNRKIAEDRFVKIVPAVGFEISWTTDPEALVERPAGEKLADMGTGRRSPCPSNPLVWSNYFGRIDRVLACNGDYVRIGMDEMYQPRSGARWNSCDLCLARKLNGHELMADTIRKINDYLKSKGKKTCIIDSPFAFKGISNPDDKENDWRKIVTMLPNDILVYIWHPKEVLEPLRKAGYPLLTWAVSAFKDEISPDYLGQYLNLNDGPFYAEQLLAMSQLCWSPEQALPGTAKCTAYVETAMPRFRELWTGEKVPSRQPGAEFFTVDLGKAANTSLVDDAPGDGKGFADLGGNYDLRSLRTGKRTLAGVPFQIGKNAVRVDNRLLINKTYPERVEIPLNQTAASLVFLHTLDDRPGQNYIIRKELCGYYFMVFEDGTYDKLEIKYNINVSNFDGIYTWWDYSPRSESLKEATLAWKGETGAGQPATLYYAEWINPRPEKKIAKVIVASTHMPTPSSPVLIAMTGVRPHDAGRGIGSDSAPGSGTASRSDSASNALRDVSLITPVKPTGKPIDLSDGVNESNARWLTRDGIAVETEGVLANEDKTGGCEPFWARASSAVFDNREWTRCTIAPGIAVKVTLPQPRKLSAVAFTGSYRDEGYTNDFPPSILDYTVEATADGTKWFPVTKEKVMGYIPEEEGAKVYSLDDKPIKAIRVHVWRNNSNPPSQRYERGVSFLQLFATE